jgi:hypothetical protein
MGELWWGEAVIASDRTPDWDAARAAIEGLDSDDIPDFQEYVDELPEEALRASHPEAADALFEPASPERDTLLLPYVWLLVRHDLDGLIEVLQAGRPHVCALRRKACASTCTAVATGLRRTSSATAGCGSATWVCSRPPGSLRLVCWTVAADHTSRRAEAMHLNALLVPLRP